MRRLLIILLIVLSSSHVFAATSFYGTTLDSNSTASVSLTWDLSNYGNAKFWFTDVNSPSGYSNSNYVLNLSSDGGLSEKSFGTGSAVFHYYIEAFSAPKIQFSINGDLHKAENDAIGWKVAIDSNTTSSGGYDDATVSKNPIKIKIGEVEGSGIKSYSGKYTLDVETEKLSDALLSGSGEYTAQIIVTIVQE